MSTTDAVTLTKLGHSCVRVEKAGRTLVLDPGGFTDAPAALQGADHVLITHEHADHLDDTAVLAHLAAHPEVQVHATRAAAERLDPPQPRRTRWPPPVTGREGKACPTMT